MWCEPDAALFFEERFNADNPRHGIREEFFPAAGGRGRQSLGLGIAAAGAGGAGAARVRWRADDPPLPSGRYDPAHAGPVAAALLPAAHDAAHAAGAGVLAVVQL